MKLIYHVGYPFSPNQLPFHVLFCRVLQVENGKNRSPFRRFWPLLNISNDERKVKEQSPHLESAKGNHRGGEKFIVPIMTHCSCIYFS